MPSSLSQRSAVGLAASLGLLLVPSALAATITVPGDHPTIQQAVNAAAPSGDVIEIASGTYVENIDIGGKQLELVGTGPLPQDVVIQGVAGGAVIDVFSGADVEIRNLRITGGGTVGSGTGGGIDINDSVAVIRDTAIDGNGANVGGGVFVDNSDVLFQRCFLYANETTGGGGAMYVQESTAEILDTLIWENTFSRGAIFSLNSSVVLDRTNFANNVGTVASVLEAGGSATGSQVTITNSVMNGNEGAQPFTIVAGSAMKMYNCTVAENESSAAGLASNTGDLIVGNTIAIDPDVPAITGSGSRDTRYSNISGGLPGAGMIDVDPMFKANTFFRLDAGSPCVDAANGSVIPDTPDFLGQPRFVDDQNVADDGVGAETFLDMGAIERQPRIRYVDDTAGGTGSGLSWADAMTDLQDALDDAAEGDVEEIWIAAGVYHPDRGTGNRGDSFRMQDGLTIIGGFAGTEEQRAMADPSANESILSGEIGGSGYSDNSLHVVEAISVGNTARLGGVIIQRGNADVGDAINGGGIRIIGGAPQFNDVWVRQCQASGFGSAIFSIDANPAFNRLRANRNGWFSDPLSTIHLVGGAPVVVNAMLHGNEQKAGTALYFDEPSGATAANVTIWGNTTRESWCAGLFNNVGDVTVLNSIVWGNIALDPIEGQPLSQTNVFGITTSATYTTVEGWSGSFGAGNNGTAPGFVDPVGPDGVAGTADDDLRLAAGSCLIDSGDSTALPPLFARDLFGVDRFLDDPGTVDTGVAGPDGTVVDRGAHEFDGTTCGGDVDGDGSVGFSDVLSVLSSWGACPGCAADVNCDAVVDFADLLAVLAAWGPCP